MGQRIGSYMVITRIQSHRLLSHCRLIGISWRLIVIRERYQRPTNTQNHRRMYLSMRVCRAITTIFQILYCHRNHQALLLNHIYKLYQSFCYSALKIQSLIYIWIFHLLYMRFIEF